MCHHLYHGTTTNWAPHRVPGSTALLILKSPVTVTVTTQGVILYFTNWQTGPNPKPHMWHHRYHDTATSGAPQTTYQCVHCLVECMTKLQGWLVPSPLLILKSPVTVTITTRGVILYSTNWQTTVIRFFFIVKIFSSLKNVRKYFTRIKFNMKYFVTNI